METPFFKCENIIASHHDLNTPDFTYAAVIIGFKILVLPV